MISVRAHVAQAHLDGVQSDLVPGVKAALEHMPPAFVTTIRSASRVAWIDMEPNFRLNEGIYRAVGIAGGCEFYRQVYREFFSGALFSAFFAGIRALGTPDPGSFLKHTPRAWEMLWRGLGSVEVGSRTDRDIELLFHQQPERLFNAQLPWFEYLAAVFEVAFSLCNVEGRSEIITKRRSDGFAHMRFDWDQVRSG